MNVDWLVRVGPVVGALFLARTIGKWRGSKKQRAAMTTPLFDGALLEAVFQPRPRDGDDPDLLAEVRDTLAHLNRQAWAEEFWGLNEQIAALYAKIGPPQQATLRRALLRHPRDGRFSDVLRQQSRVFQRRRRLPALPQSAGRSLSDPDDPARPMKFDYTLDYKTLDLRAHPELYRIGVGEQGVLLVEPYKSEILPHWRFATPDAALESSEAIWAMFQRYGKQGDFVGMDLARKFLQMGMTRARRYANHKGGHKYDGPVPEDKRGQSGAHGRAVLPYTSDPVKAESAAIFRAKWEEAKADSTYLRLMREHKERYEAG